jgi:hypothetical protein
MPISNRKDAPIVWDEFIWPVFTPKWFEFLSWLLIYGAFDFAWKKTKDLFVLGFVVISFMCGMQYINGKLLNFLSKFHGFLKTRKSKIVFSVIVSFIIMLILNFIVRRVVDQLIATETI